MTRKPILCVDFDGVIHSYTSPWTNEFTIPDPPVPGALSWLWKATEFFLVTIYSSRSKTIAGREAMQTWMRRYSEIEFGPGHPMGFEDGPVYPIEFASEKPAAFLTIDDRAYCFEGDWHAIPPSELLNFKPWNKRLIGATGKMPEPPINEHDQGELRFAVGLDRAGKLLRIEFGKPVAWLALPKDQAKKFAQLILDKCLTEPS